MQSKQVSILDKYAIVLAEKGYQRSIRYRDISERERIEAIDRLTLDLLRCSQFDPKCNQKKKSNSEEIALIENEFFEA